MNHYLVALWILVNFKHLLIPYSYQNGVLSITNMIVIFMMFNMCFIILTVTTNSNLVLCSITLLKNYLQKKTQTVLSVIQSL